MSLAWLPVYLGAILLCSVVHEYMHGVTAYWLGDDTAKAHGRLSFNPLKHIDPFLSILLPLLIVVTNLLTRVAMPIFGGAKPVPFDPRKVRGGEWGAAAVALAGPLSNLVMAFVFTGLMFTVGGITIWGTVFAILVQVSLGFFAFNILPIPPLDGSRVLYAVAPEPVKRLMEQLEQRLGLILVFGAILLFGDQIGVLLGNMISFFLNVFVRIFG